MTAFAKGRVERAIRFVRDNFIPARKFKSFEDANRQADEWSTTIALDRPWPEDRRDSVAAALERDRANLRPLADDSFPCFERVEVHVGKTPYVRFDRNDYSIPPGSRKKTLVVLADLATVRVLDGEKEIARHERSFDRGRQIEDPRHIDELKERKRHARKTRASDVLARSVPSSARLLAKLAERHLALGRHVKELVDLLNTYGKERLESAIVEALANEAPHPQAVRQVLEREQEKNGGVAALPLPLRSDPRIEGLAFQEHSLEDYDGYAESDEVPENEDENPKEDR